MIFEEVVLAFLTCLTLGFINYKIAKFNGHSPWLWFLIGTILPFIGTFILARFCGRHSTITTKE